MKTEIEEVTFAGKLRVRVCGICIQQDQILLIRHKPFTQNKAGLWSLPGGGLHYGESLEIGLMREFKEETGLQVKVGRFLFVHEFIGLPLHAIEVFFEVTILGGTLTTGCDPEFTMENQLIKEVAFKSVTEIKQIHTNQLHQTLQNLQSFADLYQKSFSSSIL